MKTVLCEENGTFQIILNNLFRVIILDSSFFKYDVIHYGMVKCWDRVLVSAPLHCILK